MSSNLIPPLTRFAPYRYGVTKWEDHIRDLQMVVAESAYAQTAAVQKASATIYRGLDELRAELNWGLTLISDQLVEQTRQLDEIIGRLKAIEEAVTAPKLTRAREALALGRQHVRQGLFVKGVEEFARAERLHDVDFLLHLVAGKLRLYGKNQEDNVVDLDKAERHLMLARRYAIAAKVDLSDSVLPFVAEACYHLAVIQYDRSSKCIQAGDHQSAHRLLNEAVTFLEQSPISTVRNRFFSARCHCLIGATETAYQILLSLADEDRRYVLLAGEEPDFNRIAIAISELPRILRSEPGPATSQAFRSHAAAMAALQRAREADVSHTHQVELDLLSSRLADADAALDTGSASAFSEAAIKIGDAAIDCGVHACAEHIILLNQTIKKLEVSVSAELKLAQRRDPFFDAELWKSTLIGMGILWGILIAIMSDSVEIGATDWAIGGGVWLVSTVLIVCVAQAQFHRARTIAQRIEAEVVKIREEIGLIVIAQQRLIGRTFGPVADRTRKSNSVYQEPADDILVVQSGIFPPLIVTEIVSGTTKWRGLLREISSRRTR